MNDQTYHDDHTSVSRTMLKLFRQSRVEFNLTYNTRELPPWTPTQPALLGTVLHAMLLEDKQLDDLVLRYPDDVLNVNGGLIGKRAEAFRDDHPDCVCMKDSDYDAIFSGIESVVQHPQIKEMLSVAGHREVRFDADLFGVPCRCKPDICCDMGEVVLCYDLKFMQNVDPESWRRSSKRLAYWMQDAHYSAVLGDVFGKPVQFRFCCIETKAPYRVQWYWYDHRSREIAADEHKRLLYDLKRCRETGDWSDDWKSECVISPWDITEVESDEVEIADD